MSTKTEWDTMCDPRIIDPDEIITPAWIAGVLEAGATYVMWIQRPGGEEPRAYPFIRISDTKQELIDVLHWQLGRSASEKGGSYEWTTNGWPAARLMSSAEPYLVTQGAIRHAVSRWYGADRETRMKYALAVQPEDRFRKLVRLEEAVIDSQDVFKAVTEAAAIDDYSQFVKTPECLAGTIDVKGSLYRSQGVSKHYPVIRIGSRNETLLQALQQKFKGHLQFIPKGKAATIIGNTFIPKHDSWHLFLANDQARELMAVVAPHLLAGAPDGWAGEPGAAEQKALMRQGMFDSLKNRVKDELEEFEEKLKDPDQKSFPRVSNARKLAHDFSLSISGITKLLGELPENIRLERKIILCYSCTVQTLTFEQYRKKKLGKG